MDYFDGILNSEEVTELYAFLSLHPDKKEELESLKKFQLPSEQQEFENKNSLKKTINQVSEITNENFDEFCIARLEGDLSIKKLQEYQNYLNDHPEKLKSEDLFKKTFLKPDKTQYPGKSKLKKLDIKAVTRKLIWYSASAAAAVLLILGIIRFADDELVSEPQYTEQTAEESINTSPTEDIPAKQQEPVASSEVLAENAVEEDQTNEFQKHIIQTIPENKERKRMTEKNNTRNTDHPLQKLAAISPKLNQSPAMHDIRTGSFEKRQNRAEQNQPDEDYKTLPQLALSTINRKVKTIPADSIVEKAIPELAETGLQKLYAMLEKEVSIEKETDEEGKTKSFSLSTKYFTFYTTRTKN
jgi:hypothetical protein